MRKNPSEDDSDEEKEIGKAYGVTLDKTWFFDGNSWIPIESMKEKRNKAACSIVLDQDGEVYNVLLQGKTSDPVGFQWE